MKKIYSLMLALFATLCVGTLSAQTTADSISFTLEVDHAEAIEVIHTNYVSYDTIKVVDGPNTLKLGMGNYGFGMLYVNAKEGFGIASIESDGDPDDYSLPYFQSENASQWMMYPNAGAEGLTYTVVTFDYSSIRTDSVLVWVDQSSKVLFQYYNGGNITLKDSTWKVVYYSPKEDVQDFPFFLNSASYGVPLYRVFHNGNKLELTEGFRGQYYYDLSVLESGDSLQILANAPADVTFPVIFNFNADSIRSEVDSLQVNGVTVDWKDTIDVPWGQVVQIWFDAENNSVSVNDNVLSKYNNSYQQVITDTTVLNIEIVPFKDFDITLVAHNVTCFYVQNAATYGTNYELVEGENTITVNSGANQIYIDKNKGCLIDSVLVNGVNTSTYSRIYCEENMRIEVFADSIKRDSVMMLYVDDVDNYSSLSFQNFGYEEMISGTIPSGYTQVKFAAIDNSFKIAAYVKNPDYVSPAPKAVYYLNDAIFEPASSYSSYCYPTFANGDVFKIFADTAEVYTVEFVLHGEATTSNVTKDRIVAVEGTNFTVLQGTEVSFETTDTTILVNGEAVKAVEGVVTLTITANTTIEVGVKPSIANTAENPYTIAKAIELTKAGVALEDTVFVIGVVKNIGTKADKIEQYGNVDVYLTDGELEYQFRYMLNVGGAKFANIDEVNATFTSGDTLIAKGTLTYYEAKDMYQLNQYCQLVEVRKSTAEPEPELVSCVVANAAEDGAIVALNEVVVAYANGMNNFIQDGEGWTLLYVKDAGLKAGDRVSGIKGEIDIYNGIHEVVPSNMGEWTVTAGEAPAPAVQEAALTTTDINHFIKLESVALNGAFTQENNYTVEGTWKGEKVAIYDKFKTNASFAEGLYDVVGVVSIFKNNLQVYFISAEAQADGIFNASVEAKAEKFVRDGQLIIRMNGVEYNVLGAKIQ